MDVLSKIMEGIRALREKLASLKYEHRAAVVAIAQAEKSVKDLENSADGTRSVIERDKKAIEVEEDPVAKPVLEQTIKDHESNLKALEEELNARSAELENLTVSEAERNVIRQNCREALEAEREKARKAANRAISAATTYEELSDIESILHELSLPRRRVRVKRRWL